MVSEACVLETERLVIAQWRSPRVAPARGEDLSGIVGSMLTPAVTAPLPPSWQGVYDDERAQTWIAERDADGPTLLAVERSSSRPVGLLILFESVGRAGSVEVRLGYLLAEAYWGAGLGGEMVAAYVGWCSEQPRIGTILAGVAADNVASIRILERAGFALVDGTDVSGERHYRIDVGP